MTDVLSPATEHLISKNAERDEEDTEHRRKRSRSPERRRSRSKDRDDKRHSERSSRHDRDNRDRSNNRSSRSDRDSRDSRHDRDSRDDRDSRSSRRSDRDDKDRRDRRKEERPVETETIIVEPKPKVDGKAGGVYIPPFKLAMMMKNVQDKASIEYQKMNWEALKKSINGLINKVSVGNIKNLIPEIFYENLIRGRGLFARSIMKAQGASPNFTSVYAALVAVINTKMPELGELLIKRLILLFRKSFKRNNKPGTLASAQFLAHLVNQQVLGVLVPLQIAALLLDKPTEDSVEAACTFLTECGAILQDLVPQGFNGIFDRFRAILHEGEIDKRVQYTIEMLFAVRKTNFADHPAVKPELDLVDMEDQITHDDVNLDDQYDPEDRLNFFHFDENFLENEEKWDVIRREILGDDVVDELEGKGPGEDGEGEREDEDTESSAAGTVISTGEGTQTITDATETDLINLRRTIYLTIMSSVDFEECANKLLKIKMKPGQEIEMCNMIIECCNQERTFMRFYGLLGQRYCMIDRTYQENFEQCFVQQYSTIHRLETNKLRNVAKFFAHLLHTDAIPWSVLQYIHLNEDETTSSSRIFIKILFQELAEYLGLQKLNERLRDATLQEYYEGVFPKDNPRNTRFAVNFFTSIGLGGLTDGLREHLKNAPKRVQPVVEESDSESSDSDSSSSSDSDSSSSSSSDSDSEDDRRKRNKRR